MTIKIFCDIADISSIKKFNNKSKYWIIKGLFRPSFILKDSLARESALLPRIASTGSPGATLSSKKTKLDISHNINGANAILVIAYLKSDLVLFIITYSIKV